MSSEDPNTGKRRRARMVLVVEDDVDCRENICNTLKEAGYTSFEADDGARALQFLLADNAPEPMVIVLDLWLPIMSGPELLKVLRSYHRLSRIPVILTSAGPRYVADVTANTGWLPKPFEAEDLLALVSERCGVIDPPTGSEGIAG